MPTLRNEQDLREALSSWAFRDWLQVLARPAVFRALTRQPSRAHLLALLDAYRPFAQSPTNGSPALLELTERMRVHLSDWSPPDLPAEVVEAARALLHADGCYALLDWEKGPDLDPQQKVDDLVVWPSRGEE